VRRAFSEIKEVISSVDLKAAEEKEVESEK